MWMINRLIPALALFIGCSAPDTTGIKLIGHGGLGTASTYPMNSRVALTTALEEGLQGVELDVQLTADSVLVAHHDPEVSGAGCLGRIHDHSWEELNTCATTVKLAGSFLGVRVDELLNELHRDFPNAEFTLDVKLNTAGDWWQYLHRTARAIARLEAQYGLRGHLIVECQTTDFLRAMAESAPGIPYFLYTTDTATAITVAKELECVGITMQADRCDARLAAEIQAAGLQLTLFGVGDRWALRKAVGLRPERIQVDQ